MKTLNTTRLNLRPFNIDDVSAFTTFLKDKMSNPLSVYDSQWPTEENEVRGVISYFTKAEGWYAVERSSDGELIGFVSAGTEQGGGLCELGYAIRTDCHRQGYGYEAVRAVFDEAIKTGSTLFTAGTALCNTGSVRLLEKLGFKKVSEDKASFAKDDAGNEIVFDAGVFEYRV